MITIALHTFRVLFREKIIFNVFGVTMLLLFFGYLASQLVFGHQERVMLDLGLTVNALSIFSVAVGIGARFFRNEIENKSIYLLLVRPISRTSFYLGRFFGMGLFVFLNYAILNLILWIVLQSFSSGVSLAFHQSFLLTVLEALILLAAATLASFWMRPALVFMVLFAMIFIGHNHEMLETMQSGISILNYLTPDLGRLLMSTRVYYQHALDAMEFLRVAAYGMFWLFFFLLLGNAVFSKKNL